MNEEIKSLTEYFRTRAVKFTTDPADDKIVEDPCDTSNIFGINAGIREGISEERAEEVAARLQGILDMNNINAVVCVVEGGAPGRICRGIQIMSAQVMPKSIGIRSEVDGVPVAFSLVNDVNMFKRKSSAPPTP